MMEQQLKTPYNKLALIVMLSLPDCVSHKYGNATTLFVYYKRIVSSFNRFK